MASYFEINITFFNIHLDARRQKKKYKYEMNTIAKTQTKNLISSGIKQTVIDNSYTHVLHNLLKHFRHVGILSIGDWSYVSSGSNNIGNFCVFSNDRIFLVTSLSEQMRHSVFFSRVSLNLNHCCPQKVQSIYRKPLFQLEIYKRGLSLINL